MSPMTTIAAGIFKAKCLELMDEVARTKEEIVVTKHGRPVAKLVPVQGAKPRPLYARATRTVVHVDTDAFAPENDLWAIADE